MEKNRVILMAGLGCIVLGGLILGTSFALGGTPGFYVDREGIHSGAESRAKNQESHILEKTKLDSFESLELITDYSNVRIIESDDYYLEYQISGHNNKPTYKVENNKLTFQENSPGNRVIFFGSDFNYWQNWQDNDTSYDKYFINLYLPKNALLNSVKIYNDCGDIEIDRLEGQSCKITSDYGDISITSLNAQTAAIKCDSGEMDLGDIHSDSMELYNSYGDIRCTSLDGKNGKISLDAGNFHTTSLKFEDLQASNEYGDILIEDGYLPNGKFHLSSGSMKSKLNGIQQLSVENEYGDVSLALSEDLDQYQCNLTTEYGSINLPDSTILDSSDITKFKIPGETKNALSIYCESGNIYIVH